MNIIKVNRKDIMNESKTPIFDYCRELIKNSENPNSRLEIWRNNPTPDLIIDPINYGAKLTVDNNRLRLYRGKHV